MNDALVEAAQNSFRAGELESAAQCCYAALQTDENNLRAIFLLGVIHFQRQEFVEAERVMERGLAIDPVSVDLWYNRGAALLKLNRCEDSLASFERALSLNPNLAEAWNYRGEALRHHGRYDEAISSFARSLALKPEYPQPYVFRSLALRALGRDDDALTDATTYETLLFAKLHGYAPQLRTPRSFSEKVVHRKLFVADPAYSLLADKHAVRNFVSERAGPDVLNEICCNALNPDDIPFSRLPERFALKATHASDWNIIVPSKADLDIEAAKRRCGVFLNGKYGERTNERHYLGIRPQIIAEAFLSDPSGTTLNDYKCYVFHGCCHYIGVHFDRFGEHTCRTFDRNWTPLEVTVNYPLGPITERPANLALMLETAEKIAAGFDFLRVDLYSIGERVIFGEVTVTPGAGYERIGPDASFDFHLGSLW